VSLGGPSLQPSSAPGSSPSSSLSPPNHPAAGPSSAAKEDPPGVSIGLARDDADAKLRSFCVARVGSRDVLRVQLEEVTEEVVRCDDRQAGVGRFRS